MATMVGNAARETAPLTDTQQAARGSDSLLTRKLWIPKMLYAALPFFYILSGIAALLATVISLDALFRSDFEDGTLEQFVISGHPLTLIALAKILTHWLVAGLPIVLLSPLLAMWMNLPDGGMSILIETLIIGTPILSLIGAIGGAS